MYMHARACVLKHFFFLPEVAKYDRRVVTVWGRGRRAEKDDPTSAISL